MPDIEFFETKIIRLASSSLDDQVIECSILLQNDNGPCPLVALANTIILREALDESGDHRALASYTYGKDKIAVNEILSRLGDLLAESLASGGGDGSTASGTADDVFALLPKLVTGLNVNPAFDGSFENGPSLHLFNLYSVALLHGWVCDPADWAWEALNKVRTYDEAQSLLLSASEDPSNDELQAQKIAIEEFLRANSTELTPYGLSWLLSQLEPLQPQVLFRNDHFSTIYKHNDILFTLVTDMGFKEEKGIVWQSLTSVAGTDDGFFDYQFAAHEPGSTADEHHHQHAAHDEDYQLAKQLQEKEDARMASEMSKNTGKKKKVTRRSADQAPAGEASAAGSSSACATSSSANKKKKKPCTIM